jgi:peroxiredoxin Q/BCP
MKYLMVAAAMLVSAPAWAALQVGAVAPDFVTPATLGPTVFQFSLAAALKKGPVVLYFYPAAFTSTCTEEAHEFADAVPQFAAMGATVIGVSQDGITKLQKFATTECRSKFPVASDGTGHISHAYDAVMGPGFLGYSARTSYVILPDGRISLAYSDPEAAGHITKTLAAVKAWKNSK